MKVVEFEIKHIHFIFLLFSLKFLQWEYIKFY